MLIVTKINDLLDDQSEGVNSTEDVIALFEGTFLPILDTFKELIGKSKDKKIFADGLIKIFTILLSTKTLTLTKIKQMIRTSIKIALEL